MRSPIASLLLPLVGALVPASARADAPPQTPVAVVVMGAPPEAAREIERRLTQRAEALDRRVVRDPAAVGPRTPAIDPALLARLAEVEADLGRARELAGRLLERDALAVLARARAKLDGLMALPGAGAWVAELDTLEAIVAYQAGLPALAEHRLRAAATLDPSRMLGRAEAPPELVERAWVIARGVAAGPRSAFVVSADAPGATVTLDDLPVGPAGARVEAAVGAHVLRIEAPGHRPYARRIEVLEGERPPITVRLAADPFTRAAEDAIEAARRGELEVARTRLDRLASRGTPLELWVALTSSDGARVLLTRCDARGCEEATRLARGSEASDLRGPLQPAEGAPAGAIDPFAPDRDWLLVGPRPAADAEASRRRWPRALLWTAVGLAAAGGITAAVVTTRSEPSPTLVTTIDFGDLARSRP